MECDRGGVDPVGEPVAKQNANGACALASSGRSTIPETYQWRACASRNGRIISPVKSDSFSWAFVRRAAVRSERGHKPIAPPMRRSQFRTIKPGRVGAPPVPEFLVSDGSGAVS